MNALRECPFCGGTDLYHSRRQWTGGQWVSEVLCASCNCRGPGVLRSSSDKADADSTAGWNRRALAPGVGLRPAREIAHEAVACEGVPSEDVDLEHDTICDRVTEAIESDRQSRPAGRRGPLREDMELRERLMGIMRRRYRLEGLVDTGELLDAIDKHLASGAAPGGGHGE